MLGMTEQEAIRARVRDICMKPGGDPYDKFSYMDRAFGAHNYLRPENRGSRNTYAYELALEFAFEIPFPLLVQGKNEEEIVELLNLGRVLFHDLVRLARGEISAIRFPRKTPARGQYREVTS